MALQLIGSLTSPYARKMRLLLQNEVGYEFKSINYLEKNDSDYLKSINPLNQIPVVIDNGVTIYDSRVIYNYFAAKKGWTPLTVENENYLSAIDTALDTGINLFSLRRGGLNITDGSNAYIERQRERIPLILSYLSPWVKGLTPEKDWNFVTMSLYSFLFWIEFREVYSLKNHPEMTVFLERFKNAPGVAETAIPV
jgi:glutathione S-transferase